MKIKSAEYQREAISNLIPEERKTTHTTHSDIPIAIDLKRKEIGANKSMLQKIKEAVFPSQF